MKLSASRLLTVLAALALLMAGCGGGEEETATTAGDDASTEEAAVTEEAPLSGDLNVVGSTTVQPLAESLGEAFMARSSTSKDRCQSGSRSWGGDALAHFASRYACSIVRSVRRVASRSSRAKRSVQ